VVHGTRRTAHMEADGTCSEAPENPPAIRHRRFVTGGTGDELKTDLSAGVVRPNRTRGRTAKLIVRGLPTDEEPEALRQPCWHVGAE